MKENGCEHYRICGKYTYEIGFNDIRLKPWRICKRCLEYFKLERNIIELDIRGIWDVKDPYICNLADVTTY